MNSPNHIASRSGAIQYSRLAPPRRAFALQHHQPKTVDSLYAMHIRLAAVYGSRLMLMFRNATGSL